MAAASFLFTPFQSKYWDVVAADHGASGIMQLLAVRRVK
jgi:hypothetical protein